MLEVNPQKLKDPIQAGLVGAALYVVYLVLSERLTCRRPQTPADAPSAPTTTTLRRYVRPAVVVGTICAVVMHLSNNHPANHGLSEPFTQPAAPSQMLIPPQQITAAPSAAAAPAPTPAAPAPGTPMMFPPAA